MYIDNKIEFDGNKYFNIEDLVVGLLQNWDFGYETYKLGHFDNYIRKEYKEKTLLNYWKMLRDYGNLEGLIWRDKEYKNFDEFRVQAIKDLKNPSYKNSFHYDEILSNKILSTYLWKENLDLSRKILRLENLYIKEDIENNQLLFHLLYRLLAEDGIFRLDSKEFSSIKKLSLYMEKVLQSSKYDFDDLCSELLSDNFKLNIFFESWLLYLGKGDSIKSWKNLY